MIRYPKRRKSKLRREIAVMHKRLVTADSRLAEWERDFAALMSGIWDEMMGKS